MPTPIRWQVPRELSPKETRVAAKLRRMDDTGPLALVIAQQAAAQAKYAVGIVPNDRAGVVLGTYSAGGRSTTEYLTALFNGGPGNAPALLFNSTVGNAAATSRPDPTTDDVSRPTRRLQRRAAQRLQQPMLTQGQS